MSNAILSGREREAVVFENLGEILMIVMLILTVYTLTHPRIDL